MPDHEQPILVDKSSNDQIVEVMIGQTIQVRLEENPTTGFRWYLTSEGAPTCASIDDTFTAAPAGPPGKGGSHTWRCR
jgi:predicted secreted protein